MAKIPSATPGRSINSLKRMIQPIEKPIYELSQVKKRALIPKIITFLILGATFYLGVLLNISLLSLSGSTETITRLVALILVFITPAIKLRKHMQFQKNILKLA